MNIINGILLITFVAFHKFKHADGTGNLFPDEHVVVEMKDGSVFGGGIVSAGIEVPVPTWLVHTERSRDGTLRVFIRMRDGICFTASLTERRIAERHAPTLPQEIIVKRAISPRRIARDIQFFDISQSIPNTLIGHNLIFVAMEDGTVFLAILDL